MAYKYNPITNTMDLISTPGDDVELDDAYEHSQGDGSDHEDVATNTTHTIGNGSDHEDVAANTLLSHAQNTDTGLGPYLEHPPAIPIEWGLDGVSPPDAVITLIDTFKIPVREFRGDVGNQDVYIPWKAVADLVGGTIKFRVSGYVTNATAPANNETVVFTLAGSARAPSVRLNTAMGVVVAATFTADATYVQYDYWETGWSGDVTITNLAASRDVMMQLIRTQSADTYEQKIGVAWIEIEFTRTVSN